MAVGTCQLHAACQLHAQGIAQGIYLSLLALNLSACSLASHLHLDCHPGCRYFHTEAVAAVVAEPEGGDWSQAELPGSGTDHSHECGRAPSVANTVG